MKQGSTCPLAITIYDADLTRADWVIVSLKPNWGQPLEFRDEDLAISFDGEATVILLSLSQEQSLSFRPGYARIDCNWMMDGERCGAKPLDFSVSDTLLRREVD